MALVSAYHTDTDPRRFPFTTSRDWSSWRTGIKDGNDKPGTGGYRLCDLLRTQAIYRQVLEGKYEQQTQLTSWRQKGARLARCSHSAAEYVIPQRILSVRCHPTQSFVPPEVLLGRSPLPIS